MLWPAGQRSFVHTKLMGFARALPILRLLTVSGFRRDGWPIGCVVCVVRSGCQVAGYRPLATAWWKVE